MLPMVKSSKMGKTGLEQIVEGPEDWIQEFDF